MRLAFNATSLLSPLTGIGQYSRHLAMGLADRQDIDPEFFYGAFWSKEVRCEPHPVAANLLPWVRNHVPFAYTLRRSVQNHQFAKRTQQQRFNIYHEPGTLLLPFDGPTVLTVHDLAWIRYPQTHPPRRVQAMNKYFEPGLSRASLILTDSEFIKRELTDMFGVPPERIRSVPLGVEPMFRPCSAEETQSLLNRYNLMHGQYLLTVGTLEPRKNLQTVLHAYMLLPQKIRKRFPLVLAGIKGWHMSALEQQIAPLVAAGEIRQLGYLPREELATVIAGALALIYPSIYEGFGLPPLEAMACGVPVIASGVSSLPEVVGDAGLLIDPHDTEAVAQAMQRLITDPGIRLHLSQKALARSARFSWGKCVEQTIDVYRQVLKGTPD